MKNTYLIVARLSPFNHIKNDFMSIIKNHEKYFRRLLYLRELMRQKRPQKLREYTVAEIAATIRSVYAIPVEFEERFAACLVGRIAINTKLYLLYQLTNLSEVSNFLFSYCDSKGVISIVPCVREPLYISPFGNLMPSPVNLMKIDKLEALSLN